VIPYEAPWMKSSRTRADSQPDLEMIALLEKQGFDAAVIFTVYSQNPLPAALLCYLANIPLRLAHCRENPYQLLTDWVPDSSPMDSGRHEVRRQLDLVAQVGFTTPDERLSVAFPPAARPQALAKAVEAGLQPEKSWLILHPGASAPSRRYPPMYYAEAARQLNEMGVQVVLTGSAAEAGLAETIRQDSGSLTYSLAGMLNLAELSALLQAAPLLVSNNTGPVHLAAAVGTPVVDLYALTNPQHTPWMVPHRVLNQDVPCKFCYKSVCPEGHHQCLRGVAPEEVVQAACELLSKSRENGRQAAREVKT
jgi:lipopolysaccharide heptosyltransferase II